MSPWEPSLDLESLREAYATGSLTPSSLVEEVLARNISRGDDSIWITILPREQLIGLARSIERQGPSGLPLYGVPFAVKDNIDLAGVPTTAACPAYEYTPERSAPVVERLLAAGAIPIGKTNMDQFATGLVGLRSPYGAPRNPFDPAYIPGGSSSGSAVAVASGLVTFALGTDTAGSGRVPAAFNNLIGLKPTRGLLSARGVVPACRTLDCVSIFSLCAEDAEEILAVTAGFDAEDPFSREAPVTSAGSAERFRFGVPSKSDLEFFGNADGPGLFAAAVARLEELGGEARVIDFSPFRETARLLYGGPWLAERYGVVRELLDKDPEALHPVTREVIAPAAKLTAVDAFAADYRLRELARRTEPVWREVDFLLTPTAGTIHRVADVEAEPIARNTELGYYTNCVNLLDLCGLAVPAGFQANGLPFGVTIVAQPFRERMLLEIGARLHRGARLAMGATGQALPPARMRPAGGRDARVAIAVCGAHMSGLPLNHELTDRGARLITSARTAPCYRLYALTGTQPARPGMVRVAEGGGRIAVELWEMAPEYFADFVSRIPAPLAIGTVELADGSSVKGFVCEAYVATSAEDVTHLGGWRAYLSR